MKVGDLVKLKRASIGIPMDTLGLLTVKKDLFDDAPPDGYRRGDFDMTIWEVQMLGAVKQRTRRYMSRDLEVISASR
jgi:hypothetical protein